MGLIILPLEEAWFQLPFDVPLLVKDLLFLVFRDETKFLEDLEDVFFRQPFIGILWHLTNLFERLGNSTTY
jgi:hypothetical protein